MPISYDHFTDKIVFQRENSLYRYYLIIMHFTINFQFLLINNYIIEYLHVVLIEMHKVIINARIYSPKISRNNMKYGRNSANK